MKTLTIALAFLAGLPLAASAQVTKEDIKKLTGAGISDDVILSYVKANGGVARLSADDMVELKQSGASEKLLSSILSVAPSAEPRTAPAAAPAPAPANTYVYNTTPYYYTPSSAYYSDYYYPSSYYYPYYSYSYYPRYYSTSCYPRSSYYYSSCYPRYYSSGVSIGVYGGGHYGGGRGYVGVSGYRR